jgi:hypothetical protein
VLGAEKLTGRVVTRHLEYEHGKEHFMGMYVIQCESTGEVESGVSPRRIVALEDKAGQHNKRADLEFDVPDSSSRPHGAHRGRLSLAHLHALATYCVQRLENEVGSLVAAGGAASERAKEERDHVITLLRHSLFLLIQAPPVYRATHMGRQDLDRDMSRYLKLLVELLVKVRNWRRVTRDLPDVDQAGPSEEELAQRLVHYRAMIRSAGHGEERLRPEAFEEMNYALNACRETGLHKAVVEVIAELRLWRIRVPFGTYVAALNACQKEEHTHDDLTERIIDMMIEDGLRRQLDELKCPSR